jgi:hypothetical protein
MITLRNEPSRIPLTIEEHSRPTARWYVISDVDRNERCTFEMDAHVVEFENESYPDVLYVVLFHTARGLPNFLYAPEDGLMGLSDEVAITHALAAYRAAHPGLIPLPALQEASDSEPEGR